MPSFFSDEEDEDESNDEAESAAKAPVPVSPTSPTPQQQKRTSLTPGSGTMFSDSSSDEEPKASNGRLASGSTAIVPTTAGGGRSSNSNSNSNSSSNTTTATPLTPKTTTTTTSTPTRVNSTSNTRSNGIPGNMSNSTTPAQPATLTRRKVSFEEDQKATSGLFGDSSDENEEEAVAQNTVVAQKETSADATKKAAPMSFFDDSDESGEEAGEEVESSTSSVIIPASPVLDAVSPAISVAPQLRRGPSGTDLGLEEVKKIALLEHEKHSRASLLGDSIHWERQAEILAKQLENLQAQTEENEEIWSHAQQRREHEWEMELRRRDIELYEWIPMKHEDERGQLLRGALEQVSKAKRVLSHGRSEIVWACQSLAEENTLLEAKLAAKEKSLEDLQDDVARLTEENQGLQDTLTLSLTADRHPSPPCSEEDAVATRTVLAHVYSASSSSSSKGVEADLRNEIAVLRQERQETEGLLLEYQQRESRDSQVTAQLTGELLRDAKQMEDRIQRLRQDSQLTDEMWEELQRLREEQKAEQALREENRLLRQKVEVNDQLREEIARLRAEAESSRAEAQMKAEGEIAESRQMVAKLKAELAAATGGNEKVHTALHTAFVGQHSNGEDSLTQAVLRAMSGRSELRAPTVFHKTWDSEAIHRFHGNGEDTNGRGKLLSLARNSAGAVAELLKQVRGLNDASVLLGDQGGVRAVAATAAQLRAVKALERQTGRLERTNHEWASSLGNGNYKGDSDGERQAEPRITSVDEESLTPQERGAALTAVLRRTESRLERLHSRLARLNSVSQSKPM
eukprot:TRINITY_DN14720_c0_g1_i1.p1 TRINITY_DN14720_c0_g1~~TRINITY_DN14720_c0_g1_i1.p1  ORF type:complete len:800 (+),score=183.40 TRINITY_DN14720_c0_g1_i1:30-2429(+)